MSVHKEIKLFNKDSALLSINVTPSAILISVVDKGEAISVTQSSEDMRRLARFILDEVKEDQK